MAYSFYYRIPNHVNISDSVQFVLRFSPGYYYQQYVCIILKLTSQVLARTYTISVKFTNYSMNIYGC